MAVEGENQGGLGGFTKQAAGMTFGSLAALWTKENATATAFTLGTAGLGAWANAGKLGGVGTNAIAHMGKAATALEPAGRAMMFGSALSGGVQIGEGIGGQDIWGNALNPEQRQQRLVGGAVSSVLSLGGVAAAAGRLGALSKPALGLLTGYGTLSDGQDIGAAMTGRDAEGNPLGLWERLQRGGTGLLGALDLASPGGKYLVGSEPEVKAPGAKPHETTPKTEGLDSLQAPEKNKMPANRLTDAELAKTTFTPTKVGNEEHHVSFRRHGGQVELEVCSLACGNIRKKIQDVIKDRRTTRELQPELQALQERVTNVEKGIENASMSHADVIRESGEIANKFREIGERNPHMGQALNKPQIFEDTYEPQTEGDSASYNRVRVNNLEVNGKRLEVEPRQIIDVDQHKSLSISEDADILYAVRDKNTGAVIKVGETSGIGYETRFERYKSAANQLGLNVEIEVTVAKGMGGERSVRKQYESVLRERLEAAGNIQPWENENRRLGREGPGTPFDPLPGGSSKQGGSPNLRDRGYAWNRQPGVQQGYLFPPGTHTGNAAPRTRSHAATNPDQLAQFLKEQPNITKKDIATHFGVSDKAVGKWFKSQTWTSRLEELGVDITKWLPKNKK